MYINTTMLQLLISKLAGHATGPRKEGYIPKKCPETISKITGLIHKSLITYNLYQMY